MSGPAATGVVVVHVVGQVRHPGVIELPAGSRVVDAVAKAGGATKGADLSAVNLARVLVDGEQILIPKPGEAVGASAPGAGAGGAASGPAAPAPINLNSADLTALDGLPGVGPVLAGRILAWRAEHGRFSSVDELGEVSGIGEKVLANLRPLVTV
ncbi:MAG: helix-hairpin-helix domain-containing protein [Tetrasphaera sp.]|nr:helix-hairpin-helix domain-containing protein [Tetrasphaera sp.]